MKKLTYFLIALTFVVTGSSLTSCKKIVEDLLVITLQDVHFESTVDVSELLTKNDGFGFGGSKTLIPSQVSAVMPYLATIREVNITEIKVVVTSVTPASGLELLDAAFSITDLSNDEAFVYTLPEAQAIAVGTEFVIDSSSPNFGVVSEIITNMHEANIFMGGTANQTGFLLSFKYSITADITVGVPES